MKTRSAGLLLGGVFIIAASAGQGQAQAGSTRRPNVVLILTDDVGYGDLGSYGAPNVKTPHIDGLARDGVRFTDFYANGATCTVHFTGGRSPFVTSTSLMNKADWLERARAQASSMSASI